MLTAERVAAYLRKEELIDARTVVTGGLSIVDSSRRNLSFRVTRSDGPSYLLKQGLGPDRQDAIAHEARVYAFLERQRPAGDVAAFLPKCHRYDAADDLLVLELIRDARTLREHHLERRRFSTRLAALLGKAVAGLHRIEPSARTARNDGGGVGGTVPWILSVHLPGLNLFHEFSHANVQVIKIIQGHAEFCRQLDALRAAWQVDAFIHNDLKWDNCLVSADGSGRATRLKLVDWELASYGDPGWDVGSALAEYLGFWLLSIPVAGETPPERWIELAQFPLARMQPAMRAFWHSYVTHSGAGEPAAARLLHRSVRFSAARLIQTAMEQTQMTAQLTGNTLAMLQVSHNILSRPREAIVHLLGIPGIP